MATLHELVKVETEERILVSLNLWLDCPLCMFILCREFCGCQFVNVFCGTDSSLILGDSYCNMGDCFVSGCLIAVTEY